MKKGMTKRLTVPSIIFICLTTTLLVGCSQPSEQKNNTAASSSSTTTTEPSNNSNTSTVTVGSDITFPPFEYMENNQPKGFDIEIMDAILTENGSKANYVDTRFSNLIPGLDGKKFDVLISGLYITPERLQKVNMIPYFKTYEALLVRSDSNFKPKTRDELCGKSVATQKGAIYPLQIQQFSKESCEAKGKPAIIIKEFETSPQAIQALLSSAVDAQYDDVGVAKEAVKKLNNRVVISSTDKFIPILGGIAVRKGDIATYNKINEGLNKIKASGKYDQLIKQYDLVAPTDEESKSATSES